MTPDEFTRRFSAAGGALLPGQEHVMASGVGVLVVEGDRGSGKSFSLLPWMLTRDAAELHAIVVPYLSHAPHLLHGPLAWLQKLGIEFVYGRRPPKEWNVFDPKAARREGFLALSTGACFLVIAQRDKRIRGWKFGGAFVDLDELTDELPLAVNRAQSSVITTYYASAVLARLRVNGRLSSVKVVRLSAAGNVYLPVPYRERIAGERVNA